MNLLQRLRVKFKLKQAEQVLQLQPVGEDIKKSLEQLDKPVPPKPKGRVIKQTRHSEFNPDTNRSGGRIVKVMPKKLQKIKQAQEKFEDDGEEPKIEDLENWLAKGA